MSFRALIRQPSGFLPLLMSAAALSLVLGYIALFGIERQEDEGTAAHLFQLLLVSEVPIVAFFAIKWLPVSPGSALSVLALQIGAVIADLSLILILEW